MRVGVVTTSYPREPGDAAGNFVAGHVDWLVAQGHEVEVICAGHSARPHRAWQPGVSIVPVPARPGLFYAGGAPEALEGHALTTGWPSAARFSARLALCVARRIRDWDMVFSHWLLPSALPIGLSRHGRQVRSLAIAHSGDVHLARRLGLSGALGHWLRASRMGISFVSRALRERFLDGIGSARLGEWIAANSAVVPMGIDVARFRALRRHGPSSLDHELRILFLGRLVPIKGVSVLLRALRWLEREPGVAPSHVSMNLTIAGDGPCRAALEAEARALGSSTRVRFAGEVSLDERDRLLARAHLLVLPSVPRADGRTEGTPVSALESLAAGVPVIASRTGGLAELPGDVVTLVAPGDAPGLARAIAHRARGHGYERRIEAGARLADEYDWQRVGARLWALSGRCPV